MGGRDRLILGLWNVLCDRCGFKYKSNELRETWDHLRVCETCYETRHPQDFVRSVADMSSVAYVRTDSEINHTTGQPVVDVSPTFNCDTYEMIPLGFTHFTVDTTVIKGYITGPAFVDDGVTVTVRCTLEIR